MVEGWNIGSGTLGRYVAVLSVCPLLFVGDEAQDTINGYSIRFIGLGSPEQCLDIMYEYVYKVEPKRCNPKPCAIGECTP